MFEEEEGARRRRRINDNDDDDGKRSPAKAGSDPVAVRRVERVAAWPAYPGEELGQDQQLHDDGCGHA